MHSLEVMHARNAAAAVREHERALRIQKSPSELLSGCQEYPKDLLTELAELCDALQAERNARVLVVC